MFIKSTIVCFVAFLVSVNINAAEKDVDSPPTFQPPVIPEPLADGQSIEPEINIIQKEDRTVEEYRINGRLYMIKVTPVRGYPYYLMDTDGEGQLESQQFELDSGLLIPNWILLEW